MSKRILVTGGAGFVAHHFIEHVLKNTDWDVVSLDRLDTSGNLNRLANIDSWEKNKTRVKIVFHDLRGAINAQISKAIGPVEEIFHLAAASHVDRSIQYPMEFVLDNVVGTENLLEWSMGLDSLDKFNYFSTDEVYGSAEEGVFYKETDMPRPENPYAGSKLAAESMCHAFASTYKLPIFITRTMNVFGERQHPEKFIPMTMKKILDGETVTIHADKTKTKPGSRFYIHARNVAAALMFLREKAQLLSKEDRYQGIYNVVGEKEMTNLEVAQYIAEVLGKELKYELVDFHSSRPGHDLRYAMSGERMKNIGWNLPVTIKESLAKAVDWSLKHPEWLEV